MTADSTKLASVNLTFITVVIPPHLLGVLARLVTAFDLRLLISTGLLCTCCTYTYLRFSSYLHAKHDSRKLSLMLLSNTVGDVSRETSPTSW